MVLQLPVIERPRPAPSKQVNGRVLPVSIMKEQVKRSQDIDTEKPVSRQHEMQYLGFYGYPYYWGGAGLWGNSFSPSMMLTQGYAGQERASPRGRAGGEAGRDGQGDHHLRSCKAVMGYHIEASDGEIGRVENVLIDEETWAIRYLIVDTSNWWLGHQVLIASQWIQEVRSLDNRVAVNMTRPMLKAAPLYDAAIPLTREQEMGLYRHHARIGYWADQENPERPEFRVVESGPRGAVRTIGRSAVECNATSAKRSAVELRKER
jgi:hypothetical protein